MVDTSKTLLQHPVATHQPSLSWALTSQPNSTRNLTMSRCPAQMALWSAVIPSSLAALGLLTWLAVLRTSSSSPSRDASSSRARGSKLTRREPPAATLLDAPALRLPFFALRTIICWGTCSPRGHSYTNCLNKSQKAWMRHLMSLLEFRGFSFPVSDNVVLQNVRNHLPSDSVTSQQTRMLTTLRWEPQIWQHLTVYFHSYYTY